MPLDAICMQAVVRETAAQIENTRIEKIQQPARDQVILLLRGGEPAHLEKKRELWQHIRRRDPWVYKKLRRGAMGQLTHLPGRPGRRAALAAYRVSQKIVGFN